MRGFRPIGLMAIMAACAATAWGQSMPGEPHIGYCYPGGGRKGSAVQVTVGGQFLRGIASVHVSGEGVQARVVQTYRAIRNIQQDQREEVVQRMRAVRDARLAELSAQGVPIPPWVKFDKPGAALRPKVAAKDAATTKPIFRPVEHPLLYDLENQSLAQLRHVAWHLFFPRLKRQMNVQIEETALLEVTIDPGAAVGDRELRLETALGLSNPLVFQIGQLPEASELEPNDPTGGGIPGINLFGPAAPAGAFGRGRRGRALGQIALVAEAERLGFGQAVLDVPVLLNGQIMPGDVDRFRLRAKQGQALVIEAHARRLIPYLADAVPGWFQATVALYDAEGNEVAFADDYRFEPDPVLFYKIPADGEYELEIRDSIYRGREDFVYRVAVGEQPFITAMFPLGGRAGVATVASIAGWNLARTQLPLDVRPGAEGIRQTAWRQGEQCSNCVTYAVGMLPECSETEPNDAAANAQRVELPQIVNGRIGRPGDVDVFQFEGRAGAEIVAEVCGRVLHSPVDSLLRLTDASGRVLQWNDDHEDKEGYLYRDAGLFTHHADSYLRARLPQDGVYCVSLADAQQLGGEAFGYRLRLSAPRPDFALRATPSSLNVRVGRPTFFHVYALRKDGYAGEIELSLKDAPGGFALQGARIPAGRDHVRVTLTATGKPPAGPVALQLEGRAVIDGQTVSRPAAPADDSMQAFLYRHLAPSQEFLVAVKGRAAAPPVELADAVPVRIPAGGTAQVRVRTPKGGPLPNVKFELNDPPKGLSLDDVTTAPGGLAFVLKAQGDAPPAGLADNLIIEAFTEAAIGRQGGKPVAQKRRVSIGVLPAIPFEIVKQ